MTLWQVSLWELKTQIHFCCFYFQNWHHIKPLNYEIVFFFILFGNTLSFSYLFDGKVDGFPDVVHPLLFFFRWVCRYTKGVATRSGNSKRIQTMKFNPTLFNLKKADVKIWDLFIFCTRSSDVTHWMLTEVSSNINTIFTTTIEDFKYRMWNTIYMKTHSCLKA